MTELLASCAQHLGIAAKKLYATNGVPIVDTSDLKVDQKVFVSCGEPFVDNAELREQLKARVEFARALRAQQPAT